MAATQFREVTKPAYLIGTHLVPGHERELAYLVVAKHKYLGEETAEFPVEASAKDGDGRIQQAVVFGDIRLSLEYKLSVDCHYSNVKKEELTINGVALDLSKGRVVYVDLTKRVTDLTQIEWQFRSSDVQGLEEAADVAERIRRLVDDQVRKGAVRKRTISLRCGSPRLTSPPER